VGALFTVLRRATTLARERAVFCSRIAQQHVHVSEASRFALFRTEQTETVRLRHSASVNLGSEVGGIVLVLVLVLDPWDFGAEKRARSFGHHFVPSL